MNPKKIVITGGPSTGKTSIINALKAKGCLCFDEISRQVILEARKEGIEQLFLSNPLLFSQKLLDGRIIQFKSAAKQKVDVVFLDRGLPDVLAYMDYIGDAYPEDFIKACNTYTYDAVFLLEPWKAIYTQDNERYESFEQAQRIHAHLKHTYKHFGYTLKTVPFLDPQARANFILESLP